MLKIIITSLYWIMNIIRYIIITPLFICKYLIAFIHYIADIGFCFNLFNAKKTYQSLTNIIDDIENDDIYVIIFAFVIIPGFIFAIPIFILRHIYFTWLFIKEKYNELNTTANQQE